MEESYTVHRRRKAAAAARKREKTPEPSSRSRLMDTSEDEEEARRARMEQMAEDAEQHEKESRMKLEEPVKTTEKEGKVEKSDAPPAAERTLKKPDREEALSAGLVSGAHGNDVSDQETGEKLLKKEGKPAAEKPEEIPAMRESADNDAGQGNTAEAVPRPKETDDTVKPTEPRKAERRLKKKSKERLERHSRSTDSSDMDDRNERSPRRTKSPEGTRLRVRKTVTKTRVVGDADLVKRETIEKPVREKRHSSKPKHEESADPKEKGEKGQSRKYSHTDDTDEDRRMRKSESFPRRSAEEPTIKRSSTDVKKQIIPLSDDSLIQDFAKAQREYLLRERSILDPDPSDVFEDAQEEQQTLRRRKISVTHTETEQQRIVETVAQPEEAGQPETKKRSWFSWIPFFGRRKDDKHSEDKKEEKKEKEKEKETEDQREEKPSMETRLMQVSDELPKKVTLMDFFRALKDIAGEFKAFVAQNPRESRVIRLLRNRCASELLAMMIYCGLGAFVFRFTEGAFETFYKCGVKRVKRDFLDSLWNYSHNLREEDWKSMARRKLMEFEEQLHTAHEAGVHTYSGQRSWSFLNAVAYCLTVVTTIGYGHISPSTTTGRAITIVYAIFGIPMFLIVLADFGKLFTRGIKFLWAFVRRLYYTGSCRKVRRTVPMQEVMKGVQLVYDFATFRRPSQMNPEDIEEMQRQAQQSQTVLNLDGNVPPDTPGTPAMSAFAIDDEFNLPISVAIFILLGYIFVGATLYHMWEDWGFFESFYFVFISMSTIGFGDYVPKHPIYMMCSIIYLVFGLALTSMCINVVQVMLSDSFKQASQKIGATIGFEIAEDDGSVKPTVPPPVEVADVHTSLKESESSEKIAPRAKQEDVDL